MCELFARCEPCACPRKDLEKTSPSAYFTNVEGRDSLDDLNEFGAFVDLADVINFGSFRLHRLRGLGAASGRKWHFPILNEQYP